MVCPALPNADVDAAVIALAAEEIDLELCLEACSYTLSILARAF